MIAGPAPPGGRAVDGEPPIEQTTDPRIARLARRFQPTLEVSVADRFWPVSVGALLADVGPDGTRTCLVTPATSRACKPITAVPATGQPADYLRFPTTANVNTSALTENPAAQFRVFEAGQHTVTGPLSHWLADPGILDPWRSAQLYFYYAGPVHFGGVGGQLPAWPTVNAVSSPGDVPDISDGLIGLEYWFFYPYNYYPLVTRSSLMNGAPVAGDVENVDLHQGDWEHVDVLLDQRTLNPVALYTARHANEGVFYYWNSRKLTFDGPGRLHPIVQAAIGGHPSYPNTCGGFKRSAGRRRAVRLGRVRRRPLCVPRRHHPARRPRSDELGLLARSLRRGQTRGRGRRSDRRHPDDRRSPSTCTSPARCRPSGKPRMARTPGTASARVAPARASTTPCTDRSRRC